MWLPDRLSKDYVKGLNHLLKLQKNTCDGITRHVVHAEIVKMHDSMIC